MAKITIVTEGVAKKTHVFADDENGNRIEISDCVVGMNIDMPLDGMIALKMDVLKFEIDGKSIHFTSSWAYKEN